MRTAWIGRDPSGQRCLYPSASRNDAGRNRNLSSKTAAALLYGRDESGNRLYAEQTAASRASGAGRADQPADDPAYEYDDGGTPGAGRLCGDAGRSSVSGVCGKKNRTKSV